MNTEIALPRGYSLQEYRIESTLGVGGFGLTYLATDSNLNLKVAIKEYLPGELAVRGEDQSVRSRSASTEETFNWGRGRFLDESRTLASLRHPNIVRVMRFFEANHTAYMVMEFVAGSPLNDWVKTRRPITERALAGIAVSVLDGLDAIHRTGYLHRDIKPGNIFIREDGSPVLLDFGSARATGTDNELTAIVSPGYAPLEQYHTQGNQGPWSDLYALGAVLYWIVTGIKPVEATARARTDPLKPALQVADRAFYSERFLKTIDWALAPAEEARPQSAALLREALRRLNPRPEAEVATIVVPRQSATQTLPAKTALISTAVFDSETLKKIATALAAELGPIASTVVKAAAKKASTLAQLVETVAVEIQDPAIRKAFVKSFAAAGDHSTPTGNPGQTRAQPTQVSTSLSNFDAATLARAEAELAKHIGAIARVVVRRAAAKVRDETAFYELLAGEIEDPAEKKAFLRKALSTSGRE
ncbi:MAG: protein kinase domain-containing protein [Burkholderiales bacterium]